MLSAFIFSSFSLISYANIRKKSCRRHASATDAPRFVARQVLVHALEPLRGRDAAEKGADDLHEGLAFGDSRGKDQLAAHDQRRDGAVERPDGQVGIEPFEEQPLADALLQHLPQVGRIALHPLVPQPFVERRVEAPEALHQPSGLLRAVHHVAQNHEQLLEHIARAGALLPPVLAVLLEIAQHHPVEQVLLVLEHVVEHALRDARQPGEIFHAHGLDALRDEQAQGLFDDTFLRGHDGMMGFTEQI